MVRGHARKYRTSRTDRHTRRENCHPSARIICPKTPGTSVTENQTMLTSDHTEEAESVSDMFENLNQSLHYHILQLDEATQRLIHFYLLWNVSKAHSRLPCALSWPKTIVNITFDSELYSIFLTCYIASMVSYLSQKLSRSQREASPSSSQSPATYFDFDSDSPQSQSSRSPASPPLSVSDPAVDPPSINFPATSCLWNVSEASLGTQSLQIRRPSLVQTSSTYQSDKTSSPTPSLQYDLPLSRSLSYPSCSDNDTSLPIPSDIAQLTNIALEALRSRISRKDKSSFSLSLSADLLFPVWCLFRAAIFQSDIFAAVSHQKFLRHLVFRPDGSKCSASWLVDVIVEVDVVLTLSCEEIDGRDKGSGALLVMSELRERMSEGP